MRIIALVVTLMIAASAQAEDAVIEGQIFAATPFGSIKIPLAEIRIYRQQDAESFFDGKLNDGDAKNAVNFFRRESEIAADDKAAVIAALKADYITTAEYLLDGLPEPVAEAKSDADGNFKVSAKSPGAYVVVARVGWGKFGASGLWRWAVKATAPSRIMLSAHNMLASGSKESLATTSENEAEIVRAVPGGMAELIRESHAIQSARSFEEEMEERKTIEARKAEIEKELEEYRRDPSLAQKRAIEMYPALKIEGTPLHAEFLANYKAKRQSDPGFFKEPDWPIRLAGESVDSLAAKRKETAQ